MRTMAPMKIVDELVSCFAVLFYIPSRVDPERREKN